MHPSIESKSKSKVYYITFLTVPLTAAYTGIMTKTITHDRYIDQLNLLKLMNCCKAARSRT